MLLLLGDMRLLSLIKLVLWLLQIYISWLLQVFFVLWRSALNALGRLSCSIHEIFLKDFCLFCILESSIIETVFEAISCLTIQRIFKPLRFLSLVLNWLLLCSSIIRWIQLIIFLLLWLCLLKTLLLSSLLHSFKFFSCPMLLHYSWFFLRS